MDRWGADVLQDIPRMTSVSLQCLLKANGNAHDQKGLSGCQGLFKELGTNAWWGLVPWRPREPKGINAFILMQQASRRTEPGEVALITVEGVINPGRLNPAGSQTE